MAGGCTAGGPRGRSRPVPEVDGGMSDDVSWLAGLSPWPEDGFGLDRMKALLAELGDPQRRLPGRARRRDEREVDGHRHDRAAAARGGALGRGDALAPRAVVERADQDRRPPGRPAGGARPRSAGGRAASARPSSRRSPPPRSRRSPMPHVDVAVVEAGLGGRYDATNVRRLARRSAHQRRARAHRRARRDGRGDCDREACCCP